MYVTLLFFMSLCHFLSLVAFINNYRHGYKVSDDEDMKIIKHTQYVIYFFRNCWLICKNSFIHFNLFKFVLFWKNTKYNAQFFEVIYLFCCCCSCCCCFLLFSFPFDLKNWSFWNVKLNANFTFRCLLFLWLKKKFPNFS